MRFAPSLLAIVVSVVVANLSQSQEIERGRYLMGTVCTITAPAAAEPQIAAAFDEAARIERSLSTWRDDSELSRLNRSGQAQVSPELFALLRTAVSWQKRTGGAFNPLVRPLLDTWRTRGDGAVPADSAIAEAVSRAAISNVTFDERSTVRLSHSAEFEEGGFGKGYAIDRMLAGLPSPSIINFGGQLGVRGTAEVSIADPERRDWPVIVLTIADASLSTSSGSEKTFVVDGRRFTHILDPRSGIALPPRGSASVIAVDALTADILSTALYVMGPDDGLRWAETNRVAALFITNDHQIRMSSEFRRSARSVAILDRNFETKD